MENFVVSARKYRPATFDMVVGQKSITNTLKNAIKNNHLAQAFLFCGPRGVGKTTCARIMAKTINCENLTENIEACNECKSCVSFNESNSFNVHELDAASNNSVEDIRSLVEQVRIPPHIGQYKVYVIDEVHMLSTAAFNAFLKTLEEPPPYAKFILATTEKHKIIPTILSRCQIFDFARITIDDIAQQLQFVAQNENIKTDYDALHLIAQKADGAMRDALSIFDQIVSFAGNNITYKAVAENLNVLDYDYFFAMTNHLLSGDTTEILLLFNEVIDKGFDGAHFIAGFSSHLRNLLVCKDPKTIKLMDVGENVKQKYLEQGAKCHPSFLLKALDISNRCDVNYRTSNNKRLHVELALLQIAALLQNPEMPVSSQEKTLPHKADTKTSNATTNKTTDKPAINKPPETKKVEKPDAPPASPPKSNDSEQKPKPTLRQPGIGINKAMKKDDEKKKSEQLTSDGNSNKPKENFTLEQLMNAWEKLKRQYEQNNLSIFTALNTHDPVIKNDSQIIIKVNNVIQKEGIIEQKHQILSFFKDELNNHAIKINVEITEKVKIHKAYLPAEKYQKMLAKRPEIDRLKNGLDLDLVY